MRNQRPTLFMIPQQHWSMREFSILFENRHLFLDRPKTAGGDRLSWASYSKACTNRFSSVSELATSRLHEARARAFALGAHGVRFA
jgi:hypothetical protein